MCEAQHVPAACALCLPPSLGTRHRTDILAVQREILPDVRRVAEIYSWPLSSYAILLTVNNNTPCKHLSLSLVLCAELRLRAVTDHPF
jgi:hypothetical protein